MSAHCAAPRKRPAAPRGKLPDSLVTAVGKGGLTERAWLSPLRYLQPGSPNAAVGEMALIRGQAALSGSARQAHQHCERDEGSHGFYFDTFPSKDLSGWWLSRQIELADHLSQVCHRRFEFPNLAVLSRELLFELLVQPLNRRQRHAIGVHGANAFVVQANGEGSVKILGHRADVTIRSVAFVAPF